MMNTFQKHEVESLKTELSVCERKLESKAEALLILSTDLSQCRQERDQFKLMAEQVQHRYQALKRQLSGVGPRPSVSESDTDTHGMKNHNLQSLIYELQESNKALQFEVDDLKQKHKDAQGDIKLLREQIARQRVGTTDEGMTTRHFPAHEREDLVKQLEAAREQVEQMERDLQQVFDDKEEQETERDIYKNKYERLNQELNYILKGDENRILDIDALSMENKYLHERLKQMEEEKTMAMATVSKYKSILERKKNKGILKLGQSRSGGVVISQKQVQQLLEDGGAPTPQMLSDLQSLASALLESVNDKNLALSHQRKTNKILGQRVAELEKKLKTLEVSGLWNMSGGVSPGGSMEGSLDKLKLECDEIKNLHATSSIDHDDDLDLLPTKEEAGEHVPSFRSPHLSSISSADFQDDDLPSHEADLLGCHSISGMDPAINELKQDMLEKSLKTESLKTVPQDSGDAKSVNTGGNPASGAAMSVVGTSGSASSVLATSSSATSVSVTSVAAPSASASSVCDTSVSATSDLAASVSATSALASYGSATSDSATSSSATSVSGASALATYGSATSLSATSGLATSLSATSGLATSGSATSGLATSVSGASALATSASAVDCSVAETHKLSMEDLAVFEEEQISKSPSHKKQEAPVSEGLLSGSPKKDEGPMSENPKKEELPMREIPKREEGPVAQEVDISEHDDDSFNEQEEQNDNVFDQDKKEANEEENDNDDINNDDDDDDEETALNKVDLTDLTPSLDFNDEEEEEDIDQYGKLMDSAAAGLLGKRDNGEEEEDTIEVSA